ncbi:unnamed protein product, partial [marine sediment metagenome]
VINMCKYAARKADLIIAPVWLHGINDRDIEHIIEFALSLNKKQSTPLIGIQNFLEYKYGKRPIKQESWQEFYSWFHKLEQKYKTKLILSRKDFNIKKGKEIISLLNRYRKTKPYPQDWQPISPLCPVCRNIADNKALKVDIKNWQVRLRCSKCGKESKTSLENAKLDWKLEWAALWHVFNVAVEPYGKDHAAAGGSRDVCKKLIAVLKKTP